MTPEELSAKKTISRIKYLEDQNFFGGRYAYRCGKKPQKLTVKHGNI